MIWKNGDRVKLKPSASWTQPYRGWADRGRGAKVTHIFTPAGSMLPIVAVIFDRARKPVRYEYFNENELIAYEDLSQ